MNHDETIAIRFADISDSEFIRQVDNADSAICSLLNGKKDILPFIENTDLRTNDNLDGSTYNLFMSLITNAGAYEDENLEGNWTANLDLIDGLKDCIANDNDYHGKESKYLLERLTNLRK